MGRESVDDLSERRLRLIAGLGNPGPAYENTRHNAGFMVINKLADDFGIAVDKKKHDTSFGRGSIENVDVVLAAPMAFMNRSGPPLQQLAHFFKIPCEDMIVVHDDIDLAFGRLKIKEKGGHGGHKGIRSLMDAFGGGNFVRLRIGVGRSQAGYSVSDHVLGKFAKSDAKGVDETIVRARDAVVTILSKGTKLGMNMFNTNNFTVAD